MFELKPDRLGISEFTNQQISICGKAFYADMSGALFWPSQEAIIVADISLTTPVDANCGASVRRGAQNTSETLRRLASVIDRYNASSVIVLGNGACVHDMSPVGDGPADHISTEDRETLSIMQDHCTWVWVSDRGFDEARRDLLGGSVRDEFVAEGIALRHCPARGVATHEIAGALQPAARVSRYGHELRRPCFVGNSLRVILPAFATFSGGLNILDSQFEPMFGAGGMNVFMLGHEGLYPIAPRLLLED